MFSATFRAIISISFDLTLFFPSGWEKKEELSNFLSFLWFFKRESFLISRLFLSALELFAPSGFHLFQPSKQHVSCLCSILWHSMSLIILFNLQTDRCFHRWQFSYPRHCLSHLFHWHFPPCLFADNFYWVFSRWMINHLLQTQLWELTMCFIHSVCLPTCVIKW